MNQITDAELKAIAAALQSTFPDLTPVEPCWILGCGFNSTAVETSGGIVFRIGRTRGTAERYEKEQRLLPELQPHAPVAIPNPAWYSVPCDAFRFGAIGYRKLDGQPLLPAMLHRGNAQRLARDVASFLLALHRFPVDRAMELGLPGREARRAHLAAVRRDILPSLRDALARTEFDRVSRWWDLFLTDERLSRFEQVLQHGDFWYANILVDDSASRVVGVVDFEHAALGDPALDFSTLLHLGEGFTALVIDAYRAIGGVLDDDHAYRMRRLWELREFYGVLYGVTFDDQGEFEEAVGKLRRGPILGGGGGSLPN